MFYSSTRIGCGALVLAVLAATGSAMAFEPADLLAQRVGPVVIHPLFAVTERYDDNIFYSRLVTTNGIRNLPGEKIDDFLTIFSPGLALSVGRPEDNHIALGYTFDSLFYLENDAQNSDNHTFLVDTRWEGKRLTLSGRDQVQFLSSIFGGATGLATAVERTVFSDSYRISYAATEKTGVYVGASHSANDFASPPYVDYTDVQGLAGFSFKALPKTSFFGEVYYGHSSSEPNTTGGLPGTDANFVGGFLGAEGSFTQRLTGTVKVGYEDRSYTQTTFIIAGRTNVITQAPSTPVVELSLAQRFSDRTSARLSYSRRTIPSVQSLGQSYTLDNASLRLRQAIGVTGRWVFQAGVSYLRYGFDAQERQDSVYLAELELTYQFELWLRASLGYEFEMLSSRHDRSITVVDYDVNRVTLRLAIGY